MKTTVSEYDFREAFRLAGRQEQFSYEALGLLFEWLEEYEDSTGEEIELDVIALCCDFCESDAQEIAENYGIDLSACDDDEDVAQTVTDYLNENTILVGVTDAGGFVYSAF